MLMVCDSKTAYCHRFDVYVGARDTDDTFPQPVDNTTGAAAVVRNLGILVDENTRGFRLVVIDHFYSSVALALQLLSMSACVIGTTVAIRVKTDKWLSNVSLARGVLREAVLRLPVALWSPPGLLATGGIASSFIT
ncbi:LOW QUALITY PROTEIN: Hypothetical protein PHPALM_184 [Phytophthora palmivora]|uniref:PiggyBac transposable element-derived protein domain-containing protein n=1 Tax=Phytophthora palmivora TaxID=4796 RepID=A0A2P4YVG8_9STRA|nr:LOW QUALITY PROTEIN: Hypothetical protein PHPALM_184 [Phytophthora palmivora]